MYLPANQYVPQFGSIRRPLLMWSMVAAGSLVFVLLIIGAPLALKTGHLFWGQAIYRAFSYICHQIPERSFFVAEHQFAVCARCTGLYAGFTLAMVVYPLFQSLRKIESPPRKWLFIAAAPLVIDFTLGFLGIWANTHFSRFATGTLLGAVAVLYVMPGLIDVSLREWRATGTYAGTKTNQIPGAEILVTRVTAAASDYDQPERRI